MADTAKPIPPPLFDPNKLIAGQSAWKQYSGAAVPYSTSGNYMDISYSPTITWQDTTSAATYTSASSVLNMT